MIDLVSMLTGLVLSVTPPVMAQTNSDTCQPPLDCPSYSIFDPSRQILSATSNEFTSITENSASISAVVDETPESKPVEVKLTQKEIASPNSDEISHSLSAESLFELINAHRTALGLPQYQQHPQVCEIAQERSQELHKEIFGPEPLHAGFKRRSFDYWITENLIHQPTELAALRWWLNSPVHRQAIESDRHTISCGACKGNNCVQLFTSFIPKRTVQ